jgi:hypothetical protein
MNQSPSALPFFVLEPATHGREKSEVRKKENEDPEPQIELNPKSAPGGVLAGKIKNLTGARWRGALARLTENRIRGRLIPNAAEKEVKELRSAEKPRTCEPTAATMGDPWEGNSRRRRLRGESRTRSGRGTLVEEDRSEDPSAAENRTGADEESQRVREKNERPAAAAGEKPTKSKIRTAAARTQEQNERENPSATRRRIRAAAAQDSARPSGCTPKWAGPQRVCEKTEWKSSKNENRAEIKAMNTRRKIPDLEPTQPRCKLEIFQ